MTTESAELHTAFTAVGGLWGQLGIHGEQGGHVVHVWKVIRAALIVGVVGTSLVVPATSAMADDPPTSAVNVSSTSLTQGETFTVTQTVNNTAAIPILGGKAVLYVNGGNLTDWLELVGCTGAVNGCGVYNAEEFRAGFGDVAPGESRTVVWTLRVKDSAAPGSFVLAHVFIGDNFGFAGYAGPTITITPKPADIAVSLSGKASGSRITYTIGVTNNGPGNATGVRVVGTFPANLAYVSSTCTRVGTTRSVNCDLASLASGETATRTLTVTAGLLTIGNLTTTAQRTASSPTDPVAANDKASKTCRALTWLMVTC